MSLILASPTRLTLERVTSDSVPRDFTRYDGYIDDLGVLYLRASENQKVSATLPLQPQRQDVGQTPFEQRPEFGDFFAQGDFSDGAGQRYYHRPGRRDGGFYDSEGYSVAVEGKLTHLNIVSKDNIFAEPRSLVVTSSGRIYVADATRVEYSDTTPNASPYTIEDPHIADGDDDVLMLAVYGDTIYAALNGNGIHERDAGTGTWSSYHTGTVTGVWWLKDRLMATDGEGIYETTGGGAALPTAIDTFTGGTVHWMFEAGPFIAAVVELHNRSYLYTYGPNADNTALERKASTAMPLGDILYRGVSALGRSFVGGKRVNNEDEFPTLFEVSFTDAGDAQFQVVHVAREEGGAVLAMEAVGGDIMFGWNEGTRCGLGIYHLARNAFAKFLRSEDPDFNQTHPITDIAQHDGRTLFLVDHPTEGTIYFEDRSDYIEDAWLVSSLADWQTVSMKTWDLFEVMHDPIEVGQSVTLEFSRRDVDAAQWEQALVSQTTGSRGKSARIADVDSRQLAVRISSTSTSDRPGSVGAFSVRSVPSPSNNEWRLVRTIRVLDRDRRDGRGQKVLQDPRMVKKELEDLARTWVTLYEPGETYTAFVESVAVIEPGVSRVTETGGTSLGEAYWVELQMIATKEGV